MSKNKLDAIKAKVRQSGGTSVHAQIIDTSIIEEDRKTMTSPVQQKIDEYVDVNVDVNVPKRSARGKKQKFEELHARQTFWVRKDFVELIEQESEGARGEKTRVINEALEEYFSKRKR
ncbi:hypothetical protein [Paenibacillus humicola]|uniref:hypothetical protein n=1 Tax=Paenibacillus humicola TaxID=3110540 RepID=UPI00237BC18C|nr:hypothetical protein [Paenibacillus humicola]